MEKLIIENRTDYHLSLLLPLIQGIMINGRISNNNTQYCYATQFDTTAGDTIVILSDLNKYSDRFVIELKKKDKNED